MATANDVLRVAASQIGMEESPAGSNKTKYGEWYGMNGQPWCAIWVSWVFSQVGALNIVGKYAYCPSWVNHAKSIGRWLDREAKPQPGDIIFFSNGKRACHVGIVERRNGTSSVTTIEGNTSRASNDNGGAVMRRTRGYGSVGSSWYILGFFRPDWDGSNGAVEGGSSDSSAGSSAGIVEDGEWGKATTRALQAHFGTGSDGIVSHQYAAYKASNPGLLSQTFQWETRPSGYSPLIKAVQSALGVSADGHIGPQTIKALQSRMGTPVDGKISRVSPCVREMQRRLNRGTF